MAGWDEGNVFYSDQRYTADEDNSPAVGHIAERKFAEFIRTFRSEDDAFVYRDQLLRNKNRIRVKLEHIRQFDDELGDLLVNRPAEYLALVSASPSPSPFFRSRSMPKKTHHTFLFINFSSSSS